MQIQDIPNWTCHLKSCLLELFLGLKDHGTHADTFGFHVSVFQETFTKELTGFPA